MFYALKRDFQTPRNLIQGVPETLPIIKCWSWKANEVYEPPSITGNERYTELKPQHLAIDGPAQNNWELSF